MLFMLEARSEPLKSMLHKSCLLRLAMCFGGHVLSNVRLAINLFSSFVQEKLLKKMEAIFLTL